ncbi:MAG: DUF1643 domain-containing protein [Salinisphaeraceae bacterium]
MSRAVTDGQLDLWSDTDRHFGATYSSCEFYRYRLWRELPGHGGTILWLLLNPSTAGPLADDNTIARCRSWSAAWGYGFMFVGNIFAYRATDPRNMMAAEDPVGPDNNWHLAEMIEQSDFLICGWGVHGAHKDRSRQVCRILDALGASPHALSLTKDGEPGHPLYLRTDSTPRPYPLQLATA